MIVRIADAKVERTPNSIRLNSSKHAQLPPLANPLKNFTRLSYVKDEEHVKKKHILPRFLANSFVVSVFPVPTGPSSYDP